MSEHPLPASVTATLEQGLASMGLDAALAPPLLRYLALLHRWNGTYNLTAIRDPQEMVTRHLLDSLALQPFVADGSLADLGTGPGLPGIPLAIACPGLQVTLVESNGKKARFMREAVRQLGLGSEIGISTTRLHAYGPMGLEALTVERFVVRGEGQTRK
ncbi:hypothetical protein G6F62_014476 [Rhizopus arrhizus]|nr:hypothetical protein G6F62_014476 [Rhizopus arrhizus]